MPENTRIDNETGVNNRPTLVILAGPNGAGKTTAAPFLLRDAFGVTEFVNMDIIAQGLSGFDPGNAMLESGRTMLRRLRELAASRTNFAFETTLASRSPILYLKEWQEQYGYQSHIVFLWLHSPELAIQRVESRSSAGGHFVPEEIVRRRYESGLRNFFMLYRQRADGWHFYDNSQGFDPILIAKGTSAKVNEVTNTDLWRRLESKYAK